MTSKYVNLKEFKTVQDVSHEIKFKDRKYYLYDSYIASEESL